MKRSRIDKILTEWLIILICVGYPLQAMVVIFFKVESTPINIIFRIIYLLISLYLVINSIVKRNVRISTSLFVFLLFWMVYSTRLIYDLEVKELTFLGHNSFYVYSWAFGCSFIPALAVLINANHINVRRLSINLFYILFISNICIFSSLIYFSPDGLTELFTSQAKVVTVLNGAHGDLINSITISFFGELLCLVVIVVLKIFHRVISLKYGLLLTIAFFIGMFNLLAGASRGPMISFLLLVLILIVSRLTIKETGTFKIKILEKLDRKKTSLLSSRTSKILIGSLIILTILYFVPIRKSNMTIIKRMSELEEIKTKGIYSDRIWFWVIAWRQFKKYPYVGDSFVNDYYKTYSHNIVMDSLMSTGLVGTIPFLFYLTMPFWFFFRLSKIQKIEILVLFIAFLAVLLLSMTSGGLFTVAEFWILSAAVIGVEQRYLREKEHGKGIGINGSERRTNNAEPET